MWILSILPDWAIHGIFSLGIIGLLLGFVLGFIPFIGKYKLPIQIISILIFSLGLYLEGGKADNDLWMLKVKEMEAKVAEAEVKAAKVNTQIVEKIVTQKQVVKEKGAEVIKYVDREIVKFDTKYVPGGPCEIPQEFIKAHNAAATGKGIENTVVNSTTQIPTEQINKAAKGDK